MDTTGQRSVRNGLLCNGSNIVDTEGERERAKHGGGEEAVQQEGGGRGDRGEMRMQYGTPPDSIVEAVSPVSSKNRGQLRAANLGVSPTSGRGKRIGNPSPSFGAGVSRVPTPIFTKPHWSPSEGMYSQSLREPPVAGSLPPIAQAINDQLDNNYSQGLAGYPRGQRTNYAVQAPQNGHHRANGYGEPAKAQQDYGDFENNDPVDINPYAHRADNIGPSHHIPGVGLLDDVLQPPGWKEGDEPINARAARLLFNEARQQAKNKLKASVDETKHLPAEQQEKRNAERDKQWDAHFKLDELLLAERINVYDMYQERRRVKLHQGNSKKASPTRMLPSIQPQPFNAMTSVPARLQSMYPKSASSSPDLTSAGLPQNGSYGADRGLPGSRYLQTGSPGMLSPSLLDPSLLPGSFEAAFRTFQANQAQIVQMKRNNDSFLSNAVAKYGPYFSNGQISPSMFPPVTGQQARPFGSMHNGYGHREQQGYQSPAIPRPPPYQSPLRHETPANALHESLRSQTRGSSGGAPQSSSRDFTTRNRQGVVRINDEEVAAAIRDAYRQKRASEGQPSQIVKDQEDDAAPKKKRATRVKGEKAKPWWADEVAASSPPPMTICPEAMEAALKWSANNEAPLQQKSPAKPRRRKATIDPKKGMVVSEAAAKVLIANGAKDLRNQPGGVATNAAPVVVHNPVAANGATNSTESGDTAAFKPAPTSEANFVFSRTNQVATEPPSEASTDRADDPNDADYGRRSTRRKIPTPRKMATPRKETTPNKKRKSDGASAIGKRARLDVDGAGDESEDDSQEEASDEE